MFTVVPKRFLKKIHWLKKKIPLAIDGFENVCVVEVLCPSVNPLTGYLSSYPKITISFKIGIDF